MIFDHITLENFGVYKNKQNVELSPPDKSKPIILLGGLNGAGKTTFLDALQLTLYGKFARCSSRGRLPYDEFLKRSINWKGGLHQNATLEIEFRHTIDSEENRYKVTRSWGAHKNSVNETVSVELNGKPDSWLTENWYEYIENFLPLRISNLFFFDGEKIESLANENQSADFLGTAIRSLLGIDLIDKLSTDLIVLQRRKKVPTKQVDMTWKIEELEKEVENLNHQIEDTNAKNIQLLEERSILNTELEEIENQLRLQGGDLLERHKEVESAKNSAEEKVREVSNDLTDLASGLAPLLIVGNLLEEVTLQNSAESRISDDKVINQLMLQRDKDLIDVFRSKRLDEYILQEIDSWLQTEREKRNSSDETNIYLNLGRESQAVFNQLLDNLADVKSEVRSKLQAFNNLSNLLVDHERSYNAIPSYDSLAETINHRNKIRNDLDEKNAEFNLNYLQLTKLPKERDYKALRLEDLYRQQAEQSLDQEDQKLIVQYSEKSRETLRKFRIAVVSHHIEQIESFILQSLNTLLRKTNFISQVKINPESFMITLLGNTGNEISPERLSAGERQLLAVSILWGLAKASGQNLPAVIDTPMGRLDADHRSYLIERYFPHVSHQVLLLSTDQEISGKYLNDLKAHIGHSYNLEFDPAEGTTEIKPGYLEEKMYVD